MIWAHQDGLKFRQEMPSVISLYLSVSPVKQIHPKKAVSNYRRDTLPNRQHCTKVKPDSVRTTPPTAHTTIAQCSEVGKRFLPACHDRKRTDEYPAHSPGGGHRHPAEGASRQLQSEWPRRSDPRHGHYDRLSACAWSVAGEGSNRVTIH